MIFGVSLNRLPGQVKFTLKPVACGTLESRLIPRAVRLAHKAETKERRAKGKAVARTGFQPVTSRFRGESRFHFPPHFSVCVYTTAGHQAVNTVPVSYKQINSGSSPLTSCHRGLGSKLKFAPSFSKGRMIVRQRDRIHGPYKLERDRETERDRQRETERESERGGG